MPKQLVINYNLVINDLVLTAWGSSNHTFIIYGVIKFIGVPPFPPPPPSSGSGGGGVVGQSWDSGAHHQVSGDTRMPTLLTFTHSSTFKRDQTVSDSFSSVYYTPPPPPPNHPPVLFLFPFHPPAFFILQHLNWELFSPPSLS